jgi:Flp pilus assembly protein TadD
MAKGEESSVRTSEGTGKRGYSNDELQGIYELGKMFLETGQIKRAELVMTGLTEVAPSFVNGWLAKAALLTMSENLEGAILAARTALKLDSRSIEAMLILAACLFTQGDVNSAGTYLGEVGESLGERPQSNPALARFYRMQLARYQARG